MSSRQARRFQSLLLLIPLFLLATLAACRTQPPEPAPTPPAAIASPASQVEAPAAAPTAPAATPAGSGDTTTVRARPTPTAGRAAGLGMASFARAAEPLKVLTTQPADKAEAVPIGGDVCRDPARARAEDCPRFVVQFNHPVVPLVGTSDQSSLVSPITITPAVQGQGEWLNTSTYVFRPDRLQPSTQYTVSVNAVSDLVGTKLDAPVSFTFKTVTPGVTRTLPGDGATMIAASQAISVTFNQPMNQAEAQAAFSLSGPAGRPVAGATRWDGNTIVFTPSQPLARATVYTAQVRAGAKDAAGREAMTADRQWTFTTAPAPGLAASEPANGAKLVDDLKSLLLTFASPMNRDSVKVEVTPALSDQNVFWEDNGQMKARISGSWQPSTDYTVTVKGDARTRDGEALGQDIVVRFTTGPAEPRLSVGVPGQVAMFDAYRAPTLSVATINVPQVDFRLYNLPPADALALLGRDLYQAIDRYQPAANRQVRQWSLRHTPPLNATSIQTTTVTSGEPLAVGAYLLTTSSPQLPANQRGPSLDRHILFVSPLNLLLKRTDREALAWATDLKSGQPVPGLALTLYTDTKQVLGNATTDANGVARFQYTPLIDPYQPLILTAEQGGQVVGLVAGDWSQGINSYDFRLDGGVELPDYTAQLYTDRPLYRPGDTVYFKGLVRRGRDGAYTIPTDETVAVQVRDAGGRIVLKQDMKLSAFGTLAGEVALPTTAALGNYSVSATLGPPPAPNEPRPQFGASQTFQVLEYRKPEFEVAIKTDKVAYVNGDTISATAETAYFFGGPVADAKIQWRLLVADRPYSPSDTVEGYWEFGDWDPIGAPDRRTDRGVVKQGDGKTDARGQFAFQVPAALDGAPVTQGYTLEVEITDVNGQSVSAREVVPVEQGALRVGIRPTVYIAQAGRPQTVELLTLDQQDKPLAGQTLTVTTYRREWQNVQRTDRFGRLVWTALARDTAVSTTTVTSDAQGKATATYTPPQTGTYRLVAETKDTRGNTVRSATYQWIAGAEVVDWRLDSQDRFSLTPDKKSYAPGETARLLAQVPFAPAEALLTVERGDIRQVRRITLPTTSETIEVPLSGDDVPNLYVSLAAVKGGDAQMLPQFRLGYTNVDISRQGKLLDVSVTPDRPGPYRPGDTVVYTILAKDAQGRPAQADFSAALVDKAIFSLAEDQTANPADVFYSRRPLGVLTAASMVRNVNKTTAEINAGPGFGGGGGGPEGLGTIRSEFEDTALWRADVATDEQGKATVEVRLPDNLTTWVLAILGGTKGTLVGQTRREMMTTQDLIVRPALPRFLIQGDALRLSAVIQNNSDRAVEVQVTAQARGLDGRLDPQRVTVPARGKTTVAWDTTVGPVAEAEVTLAAEGGGLTDGVALRLPVYQAKTPETVGTAGVVTDRIAEEIRVPAGAAAGLGGLSVHVNPSLAAVAADGLKYLETAEWQSTEAIVSRFLPSVASVQIAQTMGLPIDRPALAERVARDLDRLYAAQNGDNGWGWWRGESSNPYLSAYATLGLTLADRAGFTVDKNVIERAQDFLRQSVAPAPDLNTPGALSQRAFVLYALAESGAPDLARTVALYNTRQEMSLYGRAVLLLALHKADATGQAARIRTLAQDLTANAIQGPTGTHWEESVPNPTTMNTDTRTTALAVLALARANPQDPTLPNATRWLMSVRAAGGGWRTTQQSAWAILALDEVMRGRNEKDTAYRYTVNLNGQDLKTGQVSAATLTESQRLFQALQDLQTTVGNDLTISKEGQGELYYTAHLTTYQPAEQVPALDKGILVGRQYLAVDQGSLKPTGRAAEGVKVGDYVLAKLTLVAPNTLHYVVVEDPLPAGFEAVDVSLRTASQAAQGPGLRRRQPPAGGEGAGGGDTVQVVPGFDQPYWSFWTHSEIRDNRVALFATQLEPGVYEYTYLMRAAAAGQFKVLPATAYEMYFPDRFGRSAAASFPVAPAD